MDKINALSKPVMYSLRFRNMHTGEPDKTINANTTFSTLEKAKAYGLGNRYVAQDDGKIVCVRDPSQDPIVEPLYSQEYVSALLAELEAKDQAHRVHAARLISERGVLRERVTELEAEITNIVDSHSETVAELRAKLATPVRLPEKYNMKMAGDKSTKSMFYGHNSAINDSAKAIRAAGFTVSEE